MEETNKLEDINTPWIDYALWACRKVGLGILIQSSDVITVGIAGGGINDILSIAILGREIKTKKWNAVFQSYLIKNIDKNNCSDYAEFYDVIICENIGDDIKSMAHLVLKIYESKKLDRIGVEPYGTGEVVDALMDSLVSDGNHFSPDNIVGIPQGWRLNGAIKTVERKLAEGSLRHFDQPYLLRCIKNARIRIHGNNICVDRQSSGIGKIDPLIALFNAVSLMSMNPEPKVS